MSTPAPYVPVDERGWRMAMGLRPLDVAQWLEPDASRDQELDRKRELLRENYDDVVVTRPAGDEASAELLDEVVRWTRTYRPDLEPEVDSSMHPVVAASLLAQEDFCVMVHEDAWRLEAACVCFPSRWDLRAKIGTTLDEIHGPVPGYDEELAAPTTSVFDRLRPERSFWRLNWTLLDSGELHLPASARRDPARAPLDWHFRVERQTVRRLATSGAVVFTIRTYVTPLRDMIRDRPSFATNLVRAIEESPDEMKTYKGWRGVSERLRAALDDGP